MIIKEKTKEKERLSEGIVDTTASAKVAWTSNFIDCAGKYIWVMSNADLDAGKKPRVTSIKKYINMLSKLKSS